MLGTNNGSTGSLTALELTQAPDGTYTLTGLTDDHLKALRVRTSVVQSVRPDLSPELRQAVVELVSALRPLT